MKANKQSYLISSMPVAITKDNLKLNDFLVERRKFLKIRFGDLASKSGIPSKYLKKIEKGDWCDMPSGVYVKGFLKKYAQTVGLDESELARRYEAEWREVCQIPAGLTKSSFGAGRYGFLKEVSLRRLVVAVAMAAVVTYVSWQFGAVLEKPDLVLTNPAAEDTVVGDLKIELAGKTSPGTVLVVNNETVYPEENGYFKKSVELLSGLNVLEIKAVSRFGKETKITRRITYNP